MGAVNFNGSTWFGGGYGKTFEGGMFTYIDEDTGVEEFDSDYQSEVYNKLKNELSDIEDKIINSIDSELITVNCYEGFAQLYNIDILKSIKSCTGGFLKIELGYYEGFQIYSSEDMFICEFEHRDEYYHIEDKQTRVELMEMINAELNKIDWNIGL